MNCVEPCSIDAVPVDVLGLVFAYFTVHARLRIISSICKRWRAAVLQTFTELPASSPWTSALAARAFAICPKIKTIRLNIGIGRMPLLPAVPTSVQELHISFREIIVSDVLLYFAEAQRPLCVLSVPLSVHTLSAFRPLMASCAASLRRLSLYVNDLPEKETLSDEQPLSTLELPVLDELCICGNFEYRMSGVAKLLGKLSPQLRVLELIAPQHLDTPRYSAAMSTAIEEVLATESFPKLRSLTLDYPYHFAKDESIPFLLNLTSLILRLDKLSGVAAHLMSCATKISLHDSADGITSDAVKLLASLATKLQRLDAPQLTCRACAHVITTVNLARKKEFTEMIAVHGWPKVTTLTVHDVTDEAHAFYDKFCMPELAKLTWKVRISNGRTAALAALRHLTQVTCTPHLQVIELSVDAVLSPGILEQLRDLLLDLGCRLSQIELTFYELATAKGKCYVAVNEWLRKIRWCKTTCNYRNET